MKITNSIKLLLATATVMSVACTGDFYEKNVNPDEATDEMLDWDNLRIGSAFSQMTQNVMPTYQLSGSEEYGSAHFQVIQDLAGNIFAGYTGAIKTGWKANNVYNITANDWYNSMFDDAYSRAIGAWKQLDAQRENSPEAVAVGDIVKVELMHRVTDTYGPIPYLSLRSNAVQKAYDSQQTVYNEFFDELGAAIDLLTDFYQKTPSATILANFDPIYAGNVQSWIKFANTLRLRLAMRVAYADPTLAKAQAEASLNNAVGVMTLSSDIAQFAKPASGAWEFPLYIIQYSFNDARIGATIETYMNGYSDPRRTSYFTTNANAEYRGVRNGIDLTDASAYGTSSQLSRINCTNNDAIIWMKPAEAWFLRAEYELRWGSKSAAKTYYEEGIQVSFSTENASGADTYIADDASTPADFKDVVGSNSTDALSTITVAWNDAATTDQMLERIVTQKYIAIFPDGQEAWSEFRRTGYPKIFPVVVNSSGGVINTQKQIRRLNYPSTEYASNTQSVNSAINTLNNESSNPTGDNGGTNLWWDKK